MDGNSRGRDMSKIKDLPRHERPREKALLYGIESLTDIELLALVIGSGVREHSALDISYNIFNDSHTWYELSGKNLNDFKRYSGLGKISSLKIVAALEVAKRYVVNKSKISEKEVNSNSLFLRYLPILSSSSQERFILILLDKQKRLIREVELYKGTNKELTYSIHDLYKELLINDAKYYYVLHNHPSGLVEPSEKDMISTANIIVESRKINIELLDHLIIGKDSYYSFEKETIISISEAKEDIKNNG